LAHFTQYKFSTVQKIPAPACERETIRPRPDKNRFIQSLKEDTMYFRNIMQFIVLTGIVCCVSGCASFLTLMSPVQSEIVTGEKTTGDFSKYHYQCQIRAGHLILSKVPMCNETAKVFRKAGKRQIGYGPALLEMPFFGLGLIDIISAHAISDYSKREYLLAEYDTGELLACGEPVPAAHETVILESRNGEFLRKSITDANGMLNISTLLKDVSHPVQLSVYPASDRNARFSYRHSVPRLAGNTPPPVSLYNN
jgi:hypothetical protein